jgi:hypothetical protein
MRFCAIFGLATRSAPKNPRRNADDRPARGLVRVNDAPMRRRIFTDPKQAPAPFMISKPQHRLPPSVESPLSGAAALYP